MALPWLLDRRWWERWEWWWVTCKAHAELSSGWIRCCGVEIPEEKINWKNWLSENICSLVQGLFGNSNIKAFQNWLDEKEWIVPLLTWRSCLGLRSQACTWYPAKETELKIFQGKSSSGSCASSQDDRCWGLLNDDLIIASDPVFVDGDVFRIKQLAAWTVFPWKDYHYIYIPNFWQWKYSKSYQAGGLTCCRRPWRSGRRHWGRSRRCWPSRGRTQSWGSWSGWPRTCTNLVRKGQWRKPNVLQAAYKVLLVLLGQELCYWPHIALWEWEY